jgi:hypothetical protein
MAAQARIVMKGVALDQQRSTEKGRLEHHGASIEIRAGFGQKRIRFRMAPTSKSVGFGVGGYRREKPPVERIPPNFRRINNEGPPLREEAL